MMEIDTNPRPIPIPEEVDDNLCKWDLFRRGDSSELVTGKRWPKCLKGTIAHQLPWSGVWVVRSIDGANFVRNDPPYLDWYNSYTEVPNEKFIEYMDLLYDVVGHLTIVEHYIHLAKDLEKKCVKEQKTNS